MRLFKDRPYKDPTPTRVHVLMGIAGAGLVLLTALSVTSVTRDKLTEAHLVERAAKVARQEGKAAAKAEVNAQVDNKVEAEVTQQLGEKLYPNLYPTSTLPPAEQPIDRVDPNATTTDPGTVGDPAVPGPVDLTTTTTTAEVPPDTTTSIEVPTTVTIPDPPPLP